MQNLTIKTSSRTELIDITHKVGQAISKTKIKQGLCIVFVPHTTAAITINENADSSVQEDILSQINKVIPFNDNYSHSEGNSAAHIKASLIGSSISIIIEDGRLALGTWQGIYFVECDGPRQRQVWVKAIGT